MKATRFFMAAGVICFFAARAGAGGGEKPMVTPTAAAQFERMRSMLGEWEAVEDGKPVRAWYKLISGGTTLLETFKVGDAPEMISVYHPDNDDLVMTHYCS